MWPPDTIAGFDAFLAVRDLQLDEIAPWLQEQDTHPDWPAHTRTTLADLRRRLGHGV